MLQSIRALRGIAALLVVIYHACEYARTHGYPSMENTFLFGAFGVDIFFVISGYVMLLALEKVNTSNKSTSYLTIDFLVRRVIRIAPIYWLGTTFLYVVYVIQPEKFRAFSATLETFARSMLFLPIERGEGKSTISPILSQGWTLYHEFFFYSVLSLLLVFNVRQGLKYLAPALVATLVLVGTLIWGNTTRPWLELAVSPINLEFAFGCMIYMLPRPNTGRLSSPTPWLLLVIASVSLYFAPELSKSHEIGRAIYWGLPAAMLFYAAIGLEPLFVRFSDQFGRYAGDPSYSIYIFHGLAFSGVDIFLKKMGFTASGAFFIAALTLGATIASNFIYRLIETPLTKRSNATWSSVLEARFAR